MSAFHADLTLLGTMLFKQALRKIAQDIRGKPIDVVLYVDRLDLYRVEPLDQAVRCTCIPLWQISLFNNMGSLMALFYLHRCLMSVYSVVRSCGRSAMS